jgi:hypothetical protein
MTMFPSRLLAIPLAALTIAFATSIVVAAKPAPPTAASIAWSPATAVAFGFGEVEVGASASQAFTLLNTGGKATRALAISLTGSTDFAITANTCAGTALGPGKACAVTIRYQPTAPGADAAELKATGTKPNVSAALALSGTGAAADAPEHLYWVSRELGTIGRADIDGSNADMEFVAAAGIGYPGVAVDDEHIYWSAVDFDLGIVSIGRSNLDGSGVEPAFILLDDAAEPRYVAVDDTYIYWAEFGTNRIGRANLDGTDVQPAFIPGANNPSAIAVDANSIYWQGNNGWVSRADIDGGNANHAFVYVENGGRGLSVNATHIYWSANAGTISRMDLDGTNLTLDLVVGASTWGLAIDSQYMYWIEDASIGRSALDGSGADHAWIPNIGDMQTLAIGP